MSTTEADLRGQWGNPRDILSLLLLVGGDVVQKAIAQLVGQHQVRPFGRRGNRRVGGARGLLVRVGRVRLLEPGGGVWRHGAHAGVRPPVRPGQLRHGVRAGEPVVGAGEAAEGS